MKTLRLPWPKIGLIVLMTTLTTLLILFYVTASWNLHIPQPQTDTTPTPIADVGIYPWIVKPSGVVLPMALPPTPHDYNYILNPTTCESFDQNAPSVLIFIASHIDNHDRRDLIRITWGLRIMQTSLNFRVIFLLGQSQYIYTQRLVEREHRLYGDILQEDFDEKRNNLGLKTVMGLKWSSEQCRQADYVMKCDDDLFVHVPNLFEMLATVAASRQSPFIVCDVNRLPIIKRRGKSKDIISSDILPGFYYPDYCAGFAYVMSLDAAGELYNVSLQTPYFFIEDVFITGFCRSRTDVALVAHGAITLHPRIKLLETSCQFTHGRITSHEMLLERELMRFWERLNTQPTACKQ